MTGEPHAQIVIGNIKEDSMFISERRDGYTMTVSLCAYEEEFLIRWLANNRKELFNKYAPHSSAASAEKEA